MIYKKANLKDISYLICNSFNQIHYWLFKFDNLLLALDDPNACTTTTPCKNERKHCAYWEEQGYCNRSHVRFMKKYCKKSCKVCN